MNLRGFAEASDHPGWFNLSLAVGDREETIRFESHFRRHAPLNIHAWYEVVFWKLHNQRGRANHWTRRVIHHLTDGSVAAWRLWDACLRYVDAPTRQSFDSFRALFGFDSPAIAIVATFPAFMDPDRYPMVDRRVSHWVNSAHIDHKAADPGGPQLRPFARGNLQMRHYPSMEAWVRWCRHMARKLTSDAGSHWRARDVEMAVFQAWGKTEPHPRLSLTPLPP